MYVDKLKSTKRTESVPFTTLHRMDFFNHYFWSPIGLILLHKKQQIHVVHIIIFAKGSFIQTCTLEAHQSKIKPSVGNYCSIYNKYILPFEIRELMHRCFF